MAEWVHEDSFGEYRSLLLEGDRIIAARMAWISKIAAGMILMAKVISRRAGSSRGLCMSEEGHEINVPDLPRDASEGSMVRLMIHREPMAERGRLKRAQGRFFPFDNPPTLPDFELLGQSKWVRKLPQGTWEEVWNVASEGELAFPGGKIVISLTPAMTLIDIDGHGAPRALSLAAIPAIAKAIRWLDLAGSIGIDFPTIEAKADRKEIDAALENALEDWPHERTAMNGFGFVQIVARAEMPSLLHRLTYSRSKACALFLLRQASLIEGPGRLLLRCHPAVEQQMGEGLLIELAEESGRRLDDIVVEPDPTLALTAPHAQLVSR